MEKIYRLLTSGSIEDAEVGLHLLLASDEGVILRFFMTYRTKRSTDRDYMDIDTNLHDHGIAYIKISDRWVVLPEKHHLRLRRVGSSGYATEWKVINKEDYLNGKDI